MASKAGRQARLHPALGARRPHPLAREEIEPAKAGAIMARIYDVAGSERGQELMRSILGAAYTRPVSHGTPLAEELFTACMTSGGNMDTILGRSL